MVYSMGMMCGLGGNIINQNNDYILCSSHIRGTAAPIDIYSDIAEHRITNLLLRHELSNRGEIVDLSIQMKHYIVQRLAANKQNWL